VINIYKTKFVAAPCAEGSFQPLADERSNPMFTRVVEINAKSGKGSELANTIHEKVLPILKKQTGFVDETVLTSDPEPNRIIGLSFWSAVKPLFLGNWSFRNLPRFSRIVGYSA
jgi:hypothetical protein